MNIIIQRKLRWGLNDRPGRGTEKPGRRSSRPLTEMRLGTLLISRALTVRVRVLGVRRIKRKYVFIKDAM